jgi:hypothetical protein
VSVRHVQFRADVAVNIGTRSFVAIGHWTADKHGKEIEIEVAADWVYLYPLDMNGKRTGRRRRVAMTAVSYVDEDVEIVEAKSGMTAGDARGASKAKP